MRRKRIFKVVLFLFVLLGLSAAVVSANSTGSNACANDPECIQVDNPGNSGMYSAPGEIYNIGGGNEITNRELTERLLQLCGRDDSAIDHVEDRLGHDRRYSIDCSKLKAIGWAPAQDFAEGLEQTVAWYRDNRAWWEPLKANTASVR